eukprot:1137064-Pelagomonas_calceolata.AAC.4
MTIWGTANAPRPFVAINQRGVKPDTEKLGAVNTLSELRRASGAFSRVSSRQDATVEAATVHCNR